MKLLTSCGTIKLFFHTLSSYQECSRLGEDTAGEPYDGPVNSKFLLSSLFNILVIVLNA